MDFFLLDEEEGTLAGRRRGRDTDITGPIRMGRPADEDPNMEHEPEDTRDMLWQFLRGQNLILDKNFEHQTEAINRCADAVDAIREAQDDQDRRHTDAQLKAADKMAQAQVEAAEKAANARKFEAKMAAILAVILIAGVLVLAGASVSGKYGEASVSASGGP